MRLKKAGRENKLHKPQRGEVLPDDFFLDGTEKAMIIFQNH